MIFPRLMIEKTFPYIDKIRNYSSISKKLFDVTTISLVLTLSCFLYSTLTLFVFVVAPASYDSRQKKLLKQKINF